jgi:hypothetical protein
MRPVNVAMAVGAQAAAAARFGSPHWLLAIPPAAFRSAA